MVARRARTALDEGLGVIACVGETLEQRESGDTELVLKIQVEAIAFAAGGHENLVIAYEPVWAIGTGRTATPEQAEEAHGFIKGVLDRPGALRRLGQAGERGRAALPALDRRRARRRRLARARLLRSDLPGRVDLVTLVVLDGWGCAPPGPGNAVELAQTPVFDRLWREYPHTTLAASGEAVGLPRRADGQLRGRPSDDRLRPDPLPGPAAGERRDPRRLPLRESRSSRRHSSARRRAAATSTCSGSSPRAASTRTSTTSRRCSSSRAGRGWASARGSTPSPTAATSRRMPPSPTWPSCRRTGSRP